MSREIRVPYINRVATSRPSWSVPNQCAADGDCTADERSCCTGSYGEISGANAASTTNTVMMASPTSAGGWWRNRRQALVGALLR